MNAVVDPYVIEQASLRARLLYATTKFPPDEIEDVRQELLLDCLRRSSKFDPTRGEWSGFVRGVMRNQAVVLIARRCRRTSHEVLAADLVGADTENSELTTLDTVHWQDPTNELAVSIDVRRVLRQLPRNLQRVAHLLAGLPVQEVCLATGKSRSRIYQMIRQIRVAFVHAGLEPGGMNSAGGCG